MSHNPEGDTPVDVPLVDLPDSGYVYETGWRLATTDIDEHKQLRLDGVARYLQEVGAEHLGDAKLADVHPHWIVLRTVIDVVQPIEIPSDITFRRWCAALSTRWCNMRVQLQGSDGGRIETEGFWICMNKDTLTPSRLSEDCIARFGSTTDNHRLRWRPWLTGPVADARLRRFLCAAPTLITSSTSITPSIGMACTRSSARHPNWRARRIALCSNIAAPSSLVIGDHLFRASP